MRLFEEDAENDILGVCGPSNVVGRGGNSDFWCVEVPLYMAPGAVALRYDVSDDLLPGTIVYRTLLHIRSLPYNSTNQVPV